MRRARLDGLLDATGWHILDALQGNARMPFSELGRRVGLSAAAVTERVKRMEDAGLITGYRLDVNLERLGFPITALIRVAAPEEKCPRIKALVQARAEVLECHHVTGTDAYALKVSAPSMKHLEALIDAIARAGGTPATSVVLSSPVQRGATSAMRPRPVRTVDSRANRPVDGVIRR